MNERIDARRRMSANRGKASKVEGGTSKSVELD